MATLFTTLMTSLGGGTAAAAGAGAVGAGAAAGGALTGLSTAFTIVGGLASIFSGFQEASALKQEAVDEDTRAVQETIQGKQDALQALRALNSDTARIAVAGYASGIGGEGSVRAAQDEAFKVGEENVNMARDNAAIQSAQRRGNARQLRKSASAAAFGGVLGAFKGVSGLFERKLQRGV